MNPNASNDNNNAKQPADAMDALWADMQRQHVYFGVKGDQNATMCLTGLLCDGEEDDDADFLVKPVLRELLVTWHSYRAASDVHMRLPNGLELVDRINQLQVRAGMLVSFAMARLAIDRAIEEEAEADDAA